MRLARWIYWAAGAWGVLILVSGLLLEGRIDPPPLTHPEYYYGFYGSALVWQLAFFLIGADPVRWRRLMPVTILEKFAFFAAVIGLHLAHRLPMGGPFYGGLIDGGLMLLFVLAWFRTPRGSGLGGA